MNGQEIFDKFINSFERIINDTEKYSKSISGKNLDITILCNNSMEFNAQVQINQDGKYMIRLNSEIFKIIHEIYSQLFTEANANFYKMISFENEYNQEKADIYRSLLMSLSFNTIFYHEVAHIVNGHLLFKQHKNGVNTAKMFMESNSNNLKSIISQTLEMDADAFSATVGTKYIIDIYTNDRENIGNNILKSYDHSWFIWMIAVSIVFAIQGLGKKRDEQPLDNLPYLPLRMRCKAFFSAAFPTLTHYLFEKGIYIPELQLLEWDTIQPVVSIAERWVNLYMKEVYGFEDNEYNEDNNLNEYKAENEIRFEELLEYWKNELRAELIDYAYIHLAQ